ncbi:MAG: hypothetical protein VX373_03195, partial [Pseudomonadota bacterium]|nr:hypothetical protein [Pseudomonadota bacterium]
SVNKKIRANRKKRRCAAVAPPAKAGLPFRQKQQCRVERRLFKDFSCTAAFELFVSASCRNQSISDR